MRWIGIFALSVLLLAVVTVVLNPGRTGMAHDWRTASREPAGLAPDPAFTSEAVIQVYIARAFSWRGYFGVHSWIAVKPTDADAFTVYEVIGWRLYRNQPVVSISNRPADARWFGAMPTIIKDLRGDGVDDIIKRIDAAARSYPYAKEYKVWPGPNSNTFTAHVSRSVPELKLDLPPTAIGKDYLTNGSPFDRAPSGSGGQFSLFGLLGVIVSPEEGLEVNLFGLSFGIDPMDPAIKLPFLGRVGAGSS